MSFAEKLTQAYFNSVYNPVYDFTTARLNRYRELQKKCISKLELNDNDRLLCVGLGTGNEIFHILETNENVSIVGVDYSNTALQKAYEKASRLGKEVKLIIMDARHLEFSTGSFDKVLCLHVMDFIKDDREATSEILRVLKAGGRFVITYPSAKEGVRLGFSLLKDSIRQNVDSRKHYVEAFCEFLAEMALGIVYLPLVFRPRRKAYSRSEVEATISELATGDFQIEEEPIYQDFIVYGRK